MAYLWLAQTMPCLTPVTLLLSISVNDSLLQSASEARLNAYAPYSNFLVGAALLSKDGRVFQGCNVENLSYGLTICAERSALFQAVVAGVQEFDTIVIVADTDQPISPCGACRQVMAEFGEFHVQSATLDGRFFESTVAALLPRAKTGILDRNDQIGERGVSPKTS